MILIILKSFLCVQIIDSKRFLFKKDKKNYNSSKYKYIGEITRTSL